MKQRKMGEGNGTSSLRKAIGVLKCFSEEHNELSMTEVAEALRLPLGTASRILNALVEEKFLERNERDKRYRLGVYCLKMGNIAKISGSLRLCALPFMEKLRERFNETVNMYIREGQTRVCYAQCEAISSLKRSVPIGSRYPLTAGAPGRCLLAWMPHDFITEAIRDIFPFTENTITDKGKIHAILEQTKREGYAISHSERESGVTAVAVPIFDAINSVCASICISGPEFRFTKEIVAEMISALRDTSSELSEILSKGKGISLMPRHS